MKVADSKERYYVTKYNLISKEKYFSIHDKKNIKLLRCFDCNKSIKYNGNEYYYHISNEEKINVYCGCMG